MFNIVTIAREYGSGGSDIGRQAAKMLGWELLDRQIIERVAAVNNVDRAWAAEADEQSCRWWEKVLSGFRYGGPALYLGGAWDMGVDRDLLQQFTVHVIEEAGKMGNCVIVGRSSQCVLRNEPRAMHVMVYAPLEEKLERMKQRHPHEHDLRRLLHSIDAERLRCAQDYFGCDLRERGLYHLCVNSTLGIDICAELIVHAIRLSAKGQRSVTREALV
jgi:cytidylate kinase